MNLKEHKHWPTTFYHRDGTSKIFNDVSEFALMPSPQDWADTPAYWAELADAAAASKDNTPTADELAELQEQQEADSKAKGKKK